MNGIFLHISKFILLAAISFCCVYFLFPHLHETQALKNHYFSYGIILMGVILCMFILRYLNKPSEKINDIYRKIAIWATLFSLVFMFIYALIFTNLTFECNWSKGFRFIRGSITSTELNDIIILSEENKKLHPPNLNTIDGICETIHEWFPGQPEKLWTSDSIKLNERILFFTLLSLIVSLIISVFLFIELKLLEYGKMNNNTPTLGNNAVFVKTEIQITSEELKNLIAENKLENCIDILLGQIDGGEVKDLLIGLKQELNQLNQESIKGIIETQEKSIRRNLIRDRLLKISNRYF